MTDQPPMRLPEPRDGKRQAAHILRENGFTPFDLIDTPWLLELWVCLRGASESTDAELHDYLHGQLGETLWRRALEPRQEALGQVLRDLGVPEPVPAPPEPETAPSEGETGTLE
jgi:hypothetical protein